MLVSSTGATRYGFTTTGPLLHLGAAPLDSLPPTTNIRVSPPRLPYRIPSTTCTLLPGRHASFYRGTPMPPRTGSTTCTSHSPTGTLPPPVAKTGIALAPPAFPTAFLPFIPSALPPSPATRAFAQGRPLTDFTPGLHPQLPPNTGLEDLGLPILPHHSLEESRIWRHFGGTWRVPCAAGTCLP